MNLFDINLKKLHHGLDVLVKAQQDTHCPPGTCPNVSLDAIQLRNSFTSAELFNHVGPKLYAIIKDVKEYEYLEESEDKLLSFTPKGIDAIKNSLR